MNEKLKALIAQRKEIYGEIDYDSNPVIREMVELIAGDVDGFISFLDGNCSAEELVFLSEVLDELAEKTQSKPMLVAFRRAVSRYPEDAEEYNLFFFIDSAEEFIDA